MPSTYSTSESVSFKSENVASGISALLFGNLKRGLSFNLTSGIRLRQLKKWLAVVIIDTASSVN
jgi:hypothetical protein